MLSDCFRPMPIGELLAGLRAGSLPAGAVGVTFDDGYADNLLAGAPALQRHGVPATVFAATEAIERGGPWWWDELSALLLTDDHTPEELHVAVGARAHRWPTGDRRQRRVAHDALQRSLRTAPPEAVRSIVEQLREWRPLGEELPRPMTVEELQGLTAFGVDVGAHGHAHLGLHVADMPTIRADVGRSRRLLTEWLGSAPVAFAYPFGDARWATRRVVGRAGFRWALTVRAAAATRLSSRYDLPRLMVQEEDAASLHRRIELLARGVARGGAA